MDMLMRDDVIAAIPAEGDGIADPYWQGHADALVEAAALVDPGLRILRMTPAFAAIVQAGDGVGIVGPMPRGRLTTAFPAEQAQLNAAIARAATRTVPAPAATRCARSGGRAPLVVVVDPLPWAARLLRHDGGTAIVTLVDPARRPAPVATLWREAFELTPCETALAVLLVAGHSLESAAAIRDCRPATLRVHLRRIFAKTVTSRQSDLVALLMRIGRRQG